MTETQEIWLDREEVLRKAARYWRVKRFWDIIISATLLLITSPIMLVLMILIVCESPGSPIFAQKRCGRDGKLFSMLKLRSMYKDAEERKLKMAAENEMDGPAFKMKDDPRVTKIGHFMRKTSLDELPQLWNVLCGDMALVGPRPPLLKEVEEYTPYQRQRLLVTPGLTCYWQVQSDRYEMSFEDWINLDLKYIKERSIFTDFKILLLTVRAVLVGSGQ